MIKRRHRVARALVGALATISLVLGLVSQSLLQFVSSAHAASRTVTSLVSNDDFRELIAKEIVDKAEENNSDPTQRLLFVVARTKIADLVATKLQEPVMSDVIGDVVEAAYRVYIDDEELVSVDISRFGDIARDAVAAVDTRLSTDFAANFEPLEITRDNDSPDFGQWVRLSQIISAVLLLTGLVFVAGGWKMLSGQRPQQIVFVGSVLTVVGMMIGAVVAAVRAVVPQFSDEHSDGVSVLTDFVTSPALSRAVVSGILGLLLISAGFFMRRQHSK